MAALGHTFDTVRSTLRPMASPLFRLNMLSPAADTVGGRDAVAAAHSGVMDAAKLAVDRLAAVCEETRDSVYSTAFHLQAVDEESATALRQQTPARYF